MKWSADVLLGEGSGKIWTCSCWEKSNFIMIMNSNMVKPEKVGHLYLVYHFTVPLTPLYTFCCCFLSSVLTMILWLFYHLPGKNEQQFFIIFEAPAHIIFSSHRWYDSTFRVLSFDIYFVFHLHLSSWKTKFVKFVLFYPGGLLLFFFLKERMMILELVSTIFYQNFYFFTKW